MRLFKPRYKNKKGKLKEVKKYWIEVVDKRETGFRKVLRFPASESEDLSTTIGNKIQKLINYAAMDEPNPDLIRWFQDYMPAKLQDRLGEIGLLPVRIKETDKPLIDYLPEFQQAVFQKSKADKKKKTTTANSSAKTFTARVRNIIKGCEFTTWRDVSSEKVNEYIESRPDGMSQQTAHFYVQSFRRFAGWMHKQGYIDRVPEINSVSNPENYGRPFELDEFKALLKAAKAGPERYGLSGYQRYVLYILAAETGLRRGELRSLTVESIGFEKSCVYVKGGMDGATKNQDPAAQKFSPATGRLLRQYVRGKMPRVQLFNIHDKSSKMIQADCEDAGIKVENSEGKKLTFHSLRHSCGSYLLAQGAQPKDVMEIMRHKDYKLTMGRYAHALNDQLQQAVNRLPKWAEMPA